MDIFKESTKRGLRYNSPKGVITTEQLWDLKLTELDQVAVNLDELNEQSEKKSFIKKRTTENETLKLQLQVVVDVIETKQEEAESLKNEKAKKEHNEKIMSMIKEKQDNSLHELSVEELTALLK